MKNKQHNFKFKEHNLLLRLVSGMVLLVIFAIYIIFAALNNEIWIRMHNQTLSYVFGGLFMVGCFLILAIACYELSKTFRVRQNWAIVGFFILGLGLYLVPIGSLAALSNGVFIYSYSTSLLTFLSNTLFQICSVIGLLGLMILFAKAMKLNTFDALWITLMLFLIVFGLKGFTTISLSIDYDYNASNAADSLYNSVKFGYPTMMWLWLIVILSDSFAYIFGVAFGKHKMAPKISPKKSWEGAIGGFGSAVLICLAIALGMYYAHSKINIFNVYALNFSEMTTIILLVMLTILAAIVSQMGDLLFSYLKRKAQIKDFSNLIPGHGGLLDRLDSFLTVFCVMFVLTFFI